MGACFAELMLNRLCFSPGLALGLKGRNAMMVKSTKRKAAKAWNKLIKNEQETSSTCKATEKLRSLSPCKICAEVESLLGTNGRIPRGALNQI
jgi:recombinational DNA repair protein RecR